jgi:hypothetical protein
VQADFRVLRPQAPAPADRPAACHPGVTGSCDIIIRPKPALVRLHYGQATDRGSSTPRPSTGLTSSSSHGIDASFQVRFGIPLAFVRIPDTMIDLLAKCRCKEIACELHSVANFGRNAER